MYCLSGYLVFHWCDLGVMDSAKYKYVLSLYYIGHICGGCPCLLAVVKSWFSVLTASGYHGTAVFDGLEKVWKSTHTWARITVLQSCPCLFVTCMMYALVHVMALEVFVRPSVLLVVVFVWCHFFSGCESVSLWYPEQWMINAIKYNNEALVYHGNMHGLHLNRCVDQQRKTCVTGLNLVTRQQQPQFPGWVMPTPMGYYEDDHAWLSDGHWRNASQRLRQIPY